MVIKNNATFAKERRKLKKMKGPNVTIRKMIKQKGMTLPQAAEYLGINYGTFRNWIYDPDLLEAKRKLIIDALKDFPDKGDSNG